MPPIEPPPCRWRLPDPGLADPDGVVGVGGDLAPGTLLAAYRQGLFPMHLDRRGRVLGWWAPDPRGVIPLDGMRVTRSLVRSARRFEIRVDSAFAEVVAACAEPRPTGGHWIRPAIVDAYCALHELGWTHSVEAWDRANGTLAGGLYGVAVGGLFAGESMFHRATDASKVALLGLVEVLREDGDPRRLLDVQWVTPHLASLGAVEVPGVDYRRALEAALDAPLPPAFAGR
ncbi:MAG: leucyl/phenylalanyl-tRNA--protein transferase [Acidimicrobiia bacterium]